ncbi:MAG: D-alanyl-D-alanine carboxypeptidase/D-alanyl-D-alanine-endopeptidase [Burkholderiales bacterium]|nr:D-alanyl-D-alanine carboxypeptidase/D-alanyl-D-alanine-endopeptidase [Burkholderiales bacterium]
MRKFLSLFFLLFPAFCHALPASIEDELKRDGLPASHVSIYAREVSASGALLSWNADKVMQPASTMKLVTSYAALSLLGPAYRWETDAFGEIDQGRLKGPLYIRGGGDPDLKIEDLWLFVQDLRSRGLAEITGGIVLDRSRFSVQPSDPGSFDGKPYRPYNVIPDALLANFDSITLKFVPDGKRIELIPFPDLASLSVSNGISPDRGNCSDWEEGIDTAISGNGEKASLSLSGHYPADCGEKEESYALYDHSEYFYQLFADLWKKSGGSIEGGWKEGKVPQGLKRIASAKSAALASVIVDMNKFSNNVMARQIFLSVGAIDANPATVDTARLKIASWLHSRGLDFPELVMDNGSGLSRVASISASHMGELLIDAWKSPLMPQFFASLPIAGVDGTMKKRLVGSAVQGHAWIKTGSLENVRAIAGILQARSGKRYVVVCFIQDPHPAGAKPFEDFLLKWLDGK